MFHFKISIITIVFNRASDIAKTISSVNNQSYKNIEHIIIDGGSSDGTLEIIAKLKTKNTILISEKDNGIYDAMNKGLCKADGDYVLFINGGDLLYSNDVIEKLFLVAGGMDIIYGDCMFIDEFEKNIGLRSEIYKRSLPEKLDIDSFRYGTNISHQSFIVKRSLAGKFNLKFKIAADIDWMLNTIVKSKNNFNSKIIISKYLIGGESDKNKIKALIERFRILYKYYGKSTIFDHIKILLKNKIW